MGLFYTVPAPNEALVITGGLKDGSEPGGLKIITGRGTFHIPVLHRVYRFYIGSHSVRFQVEAQSAQNIAVDVEATVVFRVSNNPSAISEAASRFLSSDINEMKGLAADIFSGHTRAIVGKMSVEELISDRDGLNMQVLEAAEPKMSVLGLKIDNFQINQISDKNNHIGNLSKPELENVRERAERAQAEAESSIEEARQKAEREKSLYKKETDLQVSENTIETAAKRAEAAQSAPLAEAQAKVEVAKREKSLLDEQAKVEKSRLEVEVITVAEAEAQALTIRAKAEAESIKIKAEALATHNGIILTEDLLNHLPQIVKSYADSMSNAQLTVFNGAEGMTGMLTEALTMGSSIIKNTDLKNFSNVNEKNNDEKNDDNNTRRENPFRPPTNKLT